MKITKKQLNKIKMIVCDLDGTLFNHKKEISSATITYLIKLQENGYTLVLATGRFFYELKPYIEQLQLEKYHGYVICCNGIEIYDHTFYFFLFEYLLNVIPTSLFIKILL